MPRFDRDYVNLLRIAPDTTLLFLTYLSIVLLEVFIGICGFPGLRLDTVLPYYPVNKELHLFLLSLLFY